MIRRPFQEQAVARATEWLKTATRGSRLMLVGPTGVGKTTVILDTLAANPGGICVTPSLEIIAGMLQKLGVPVPEGDEALASHGQQYGLWTPIRFRNRLAEGSVSHPAYLIDDEAHHSVADSWEDFYTYCGEPPCLGFTATPFCGTPRKTKALRDSWGPPEYMITLREAVDLGYVSLPTCSIVPMLDDDKVKLTSTGEFDVTSAGELLGSRITELSVLVSKFWDGGFDKPTMLAVPSTEALSLVVESLRARGISADAVTADTGRSIRDAAFAACVARQSALVQIRVVSEGVDLPIARLIDVRPMMSPRDWLQQFGRITRPGLESEYICCNRNLLRHSYLLEGLLPTAIVAKGIADFGSPGKRAATRAIGLEAVGRFKAAEVPYADGTVGQIYAVSEVVGSTVTQYTILVHPCVPYPIVARRVNLRQADNTAYGRWQRVDQIPEISGFASVNPSPLSEKMEAWWKRSAKNFGLNPDAKINRKSFVALPVLADLKTRFKI